MKLRPGTADLDVLIAVGVVSLCLARIYAEVVRRPLYVVRALHRTTRQEHASPVCQQEPR
jgi:hypothetical protein